MPQELDKTNCCNYIRQCQGIHQRQVGRFNRVIQAIRERFGDKVKVLGVDLSGEYIVQTSSGVSVAEVHRVITEALETSIY
jgi:hypothetical protein